MSKFDYRALLLAGAALPLAMFAASAAQASTETVVYSFCGQQGCADGQYPSGALLHVGKKLYGVTEYGGSGCYGYGCGTAYEIDPKTGAETVLYTFLSGTDAQGPQGNLINIKGTLYGTSWTDGGTGCYTFGCGKLYSINLKTGAESIVYSFQGGNDGANPAAGVINVKGMLYGTTFAGGLDNNGTVFSVNPQTGAETSYSFGNGTYGVQSASDLVRVGRNLYGTTTNGDANHDGTVFSFDRKTGTINTVYAFQGQPDGREAEGGLINVNGTLYGTTMQGGAYNSGSLYSVNPGTGAETVVYSFHNTNGSDGTCPSADLLNINGTLYGTTQCGGANGAGVVYSFAPQTGTETVVHSFGASGDGQIPIAGLTNVNGTLYGTTYLGGANNDGTVFAITP